MPNVVVFEVWISRFLGSSKKLCGFRINLQSLFSFILFLGPRHCSAGWFANWEHPTMHGSPALRVHPLPTPPARAFDAFLLAIRSRTQECRKLARVQRTAIEELQQRVRDLVAKLPGARVKTIQLLRKAGGSQPTPKAAYI
eukprot:EG_transcript_16656